MMYGNGWYGRGGCEWFGRYGFGLWHFLFLAGIVLVIAALVVVVNRKKVGKATPALITLMELYAKGEISEEEYLKRKNVLER